MNVADSVIKDNVPIFGVCLSEANPNDIVQTSQEDMMYPFDQPIEMPLIGRRCQPKLCGKWQDDVLVEEQSALTTASVLTCEHGGVVYFINDGQGVE